MVVSDETDRKHLIQGLETAMKINRESFNSEIITGKLTFQAHALSNIIRFFLF